jgi:long-subunit fatty acid transport protein
MKTTLHFLRFLIAALLLAAFPARAQKVGSTSMQYLSVIPSARAAAMGNAYAAIARGAEGIFWNPAGMALTQGQELSTTYIRWIFDARQYALAYAVSLGDIGTVGAQLQFNDYGSFDEAIVGSGGTDIFPGQEYPYLTGRTFRPYSYVAGLSYATRLTERFSTGFTVKYTHESLYDQAEVFVREDTVRQSNMNTFGKTLLFDIGIHYNTGFHTIQIGASVQNFGPDIQYAKDRSPVPMLFRVGIAADLLGANSLFLEDPNSRLGVAFDIFQSNDYDQQQHVGIEYEFANAIALRAGYKFNYDLEGFTWGAGIKHTLGSLKISFDYGYGAIGSAAGAFGNVHRIGLGVGIL